MAARNWKKLLASAPIRPFSGRLVRCVPQLTFQQGSPPSYLFTSGAVNRCNPRDVHTLYMSQDRETALAEYESYYADPEPQLTYHADFQTDAVLDFEDQRVRRHFGVNDDDFFKGFRLAVKPTPLQLLGTAIAAQTVVAGIRFPSNARHRKDEAGFNFAIFRDSVRTPSSLAILGKGGALLVKWP